SLRRTGTGGKRSDGLARTATATAKGRASTCACWRCWADYLGTGDRCRAEPRRQSGGWRSIFLFLLQPAGDGSLAIQAHLFRSVTGVDTRQWMPWAVRQLAHSLTTTAEQLGDLR